MINIRYSGPFRKPRRKSQNGLYRRQATTLFLLLGTILSVDVARSAPTPSELYLRGYSVIPAPQQVSLRSGDIEFNGSWTYRLESLPPDHIALRSLLNELRDSYQIELRPATASSRNVLRLRIDKGGVKPTDVIENSGEAYRMTIAPGAIEIAGNDSQGLFYGVQTLLQLIKSRHGRRLELPLCTIEDWPDRSLRFLHWDTKHHQDRIETLKSFLDWSARFKINMIGFELEDKFAYPSHPSIGAPGAFTTAQLQEIVNYGLERFIQVVPQVQAPAHMAYVLKHPEFADLRADGSNYQSCLCDPRTEELIFSMYDDLIKATQGIDYFFVSTDEVYYAGICGKCNRPYNPENRSLAWAEFVQHAHDFLRQRHRQMLAWVEYPFLFEHLDRLPSDLIDGVAGDDADELAAENLRGIRHLAYTSLQGAELLFPNHFLYQGNRGVVKGRLESAFETITKRSLRAKPIGVYGAGWDDSGLNNETFWLGWAVVAQYGWNLDGPAVEQTTAEFMNVFYGPGVSQMVEVYQALQRQARFFENCWDRVVSRVREPGYGNSYGKGIGTTRFDQTLPAPALPVLPGLDFIPKYREDRYSKIVEQAKGMALENDLLTHRLIENIPRAEWNHYNLEVLLSLARLTAHHNHVILGLRQIEESLQSANAAAQKAGFKEALGHIVAAYGRAATLVNERKQMFDYLREVWEKGRYPKGQSVNGRMFVHVLDDVKDHWADRRADLTYMTAPEESIGLDAWMKQLAEIIQQYAGKNHLEVRPLEELRLED